MSKRPKTTTLIALALAAFCVSPLLSAETASAPSQARLPQPVQKQMQDFESLRHEVYRAIERGNDYLKSKQSPDGSWGSPEYPAMTALALSAAMRSPHLQDGKELPEYLKKGYDVLLKTQKEDGGIYGKGGLASYNTSVSLLGLLSANNPAYTQAILKARKFLINQQNHFAPDDPFNGGIGYGGKDAPHTADLSNTVLALEALHYSKKIAQDGKNGEQPELNWEAAVQFVSRCQNLPETNDQKWAHSGTEEKGGFAYRPNESKAEGGKVLSQEEMKSGETPLRTYGSMSYAGLQSLIYAELKKDDPRLLAVMKWLSGNFSLAENPGMEQQGLYYYYQAMSKALSAAGVHELTLADGKKINWRNELAQTIVNKQKTDGSWVNTNNRWWETDPTLVTAYMVLALEQLYYSLPEEKK